MDRLEQTFSEADGILRDLESRREAVLASSRRIIRATKRTIHSVHSGEDHAQTLIPLREEVDGMLTLASGVPELMCSAAVQDAMTEYAEASILSSVASGDGIPSFSDLGVTPRSWILGLADSLGEMRRLVLDSLLRGDAGEGGRLFSVMDRIYGHIMLLDLPDAVLPVRRKQDIARSVVERTRWDLLPRR